MYVKVYCFERRPVNVHLCFVRKSVLTYESLHVSLGVCGGKGEEVHISPLHTMPGNRF